MTPTIHRGLLTLLSLGTACTEEPLVSMPVSGSGGPSGSPTSFDPPVSTTGTSGEPTTTAPGTTETTTGTTTTESSTSAPEGPVCGDGIVAGDETCDLGADNANTGACTLECKLAACGDGLVWAGVEACDFGLGNADVYGGCRPQDCQFAERCGDGVLDAEHESCDRGPLNGTGLSNDELAPCSLTCQFHGRVVFLTSQKYDGALGGVSGADLKCQALASAAGLPHPTTLRAWIADGFGGPAMRFVQKDLLGAPYIRLDGRVLGADFEELVTFGLRTGIAITDTLETLFEEPVWTNTSAYGEVFSPVNHCGGWTSASDQNVARAGRNAIAVESGPVWQTWRDERHWTSWANLPCNLPRRLYCFDDGFVDEGEG